MTGSLPQAERRIEDLQGHWLPARLGKRVLRPGGLGLTTRLLGRLELTGAGVVELAPGIGRTAALIVQQSPAGYVGVDADPAAAALVADVGLARVLRIAWNLLRNPGARARVLGMRRVFTRYETTT